jgi:predicted nuclease of predicted toxin-antitoxin system
LTDSTRRVLVDEDLPPRLAIVLTAQLGEETTCSSVRDEGWRGLKNGELLSRMAEHGFTMLVTGDRNLAYQQPLARRQLATVEVTRPLDRAAVLARVVGIAEAVRSVQPGTSVEVPAS